MYRINTIKLVKAALDPQEKTDRASNILSFMASPVASELAKAAPDPQEKTDRASNILRFMASPVASTLLYSGLLGGTYNLIGRLLTVGSINPETKKKIRRRLTTAGLLLGGIYSVPDLAKGYREQGLKGLIDIPK